jgi:outer membrane immunogenic protein
MSRLLTGAVVATAIATRSAFAADLPAKAPPLAPVAAAYSWNAFYIGGNIGGAWRGSDGWTDTAFALTWNNGNNNGVFIGGGQIGFNVQYNQFVFGVEFDSDWTANNNNSGAGVIVPGVGTIQLTGNEHWIATLAARFGVTFDRVLFYGKAGGGWVTANDLTITNVTTGASIINVGDRTNPGWLLGAGVEWAFAPSWSVKLEYDYLGLASRTFTLAPTAPFLAGDTFNSGNRNVQMVKLGVNFLLNWGATTAVRAAY